MQIQVQNSETTLTEDILALLGEYLDSFASALSSPAMIDLWNWLVKSAVLYGKLAVVVVFVGVILYLASVLIFGS